MKKKDLLYVGAALLSVAALIKIGKGLGKASKNRTSRVEREYILDRLADTESQVIPYLIDTSSTGKCFARRYANWLLKAYGSEVIVKGIYLSAVKNTGGFTYEELLSISEDCIAFNRFHDIIVNKYGDINSIYDIVVDALLSAALEYKGLYHCYDDIFEAATREKFIPFLKLQLNVAIQAQNYPFYESMLTSLIVALLPLDEAEYKKVKEDLYALLNTTSTEDLDELEIETYTLLKPEKDRIMRIFTTFEEQLK